MKTTWNWALIAVFAMGCVPDNEDTTNDGDGDSAVDSMVGRLVDSGASDAAPVDASETRDGTANVDAGSPDQFVEPDMGCTTPMAETCNERDDDCDGIVDEGFIAGQPCFAGIGPCEAEGVWECTQSGVTRCNAVAREPTAEVCNNLDDDCDGSTDEDYDGVGDPCEFAEAECVSAGQIVCTADGNETYCNAEPIVIGDELCDERDNDCDGLVDEGIDEGALCELGVGQCRRGGFVECGEDGSVTCTAIPGQPREEACDGFDNDCDEVVDEDFGRAPCINGDGACAVEGVEICDIEGTVICDAVPLEPSSEFCNAIDDDCDGETDEVYPDLGQACTVGQGICTREGVYQCDANDGGGGLVFDGIRQNIPVAELTGAGGFVECWRGAFNGNDAIDEILAACGDDIWLLGCSPADADVLTLGAMGERAEILTDVGRDRAGVHNHNGVDWYYSPTYSWGFAPEGAGVTRSSCDTSRVQSELRMCWHTSNNRVSSGYRCGDNFLNGNGNWHRVIYMRPDGPGQVCSIEPGEPADAEACNQLDDDCDGVTDEGVPGADERCEDIELELCQVGRTACTADGEIECTAVDIEPSREFCNGEDDDCDGSVDEAYPDLGQACTSGVGICSREGIVECSGQGQGGQLEFEGVRQNVPVAELAESDFEVCWSGLYNQSADLAVIQAACGEGVWAMGCRPAGNPNLTVAALGRRTEILTDVGQGANAVHNHNGVDWYYTPNRSWGFAPAGAGVARNRCDTNQELGAQRMCWHTTNNRVTSGYRCGGNTNVANWERLILHRPDGPGDVCSAEPGPPDDTESCNTLDDDCDGVADEEVPGTGERCEDEALELALCQVPRTACNAEGGIICAATDIEPGHEFCNGEDDDCDGATDEDYPDLGEVCEDGEGICRAEGRYECSPEGRAGGLQFAGIRQNVPEMEILGGGFELCWSGLYGGSEPMAGILEACNEGILLLGCRPNNNPNLTLAAMGERAEILTDLGRERAAVHNHNGVDWYYSPSYSWGFVPEGTGVARNSCDTSRVQSELRMCWHSSNNRITSGYRCGNNFLNGNNGWQRLIYHRPDGPGMICTAEANEPGEEACNTLDDDCDGIIDEGFAAQVCEPPEPEGDAGIPEEDAGLPEEDAGLPEEDAGVPEEDAAAPAEDAAVPEEDAAAPAEDTAAPEEDAAVPEEDAAVPEDDAALEEDAAVAPEEDAALEEDAAVDDENNPAPPPVPPPVPVNP